MHLSSDRLVAIAVAVVIWAAAAGSSGASPPPSTRPDEAAVDVGELYRRGHDRFETSDFDGAIELWTRAYEALPDGPKYRVTRATLLANLAHAHVKAFAIDEDPEHLRRADALFVSCLAMTDEADVQTHETIEAERRKIAELLAQVEARQREAERATQPEPDDHATDSERAVERAGSERAGSERPGLPRVADEPPPVRRRGLAAPFTRWERALVIGGGVTLAFAVGLTGASAAFAWLRNEEEKRGDAAYRDTDTGVAELRGFERNAVRFNRLAITTGAASGVMAAIGFGLVGTADVHRRRRLSDRTTVGIGPGGSLVVRGRF